MPAPPKTTERIPVSPKNIPDMNDFLAPTARIMPISEVLSRAAIVSVLIIIIIATTKSSRDEHKKRALYYKRHSGIWGLTRCSR